DKVGHKVGLTIGKKQRSDGRPRRLTIFLKPDDLFRRVAARETLAMLRAKLHATKALRLRDGAK
ncbi:hypothetical protein, partial [Sulfitobacter sp. 1A12157]|uniref:hypothetical protein n=1 Tax=Sulfitobacter sp. 1A12157 TaxID=3368594 RepID=UPI003744CF58